MESISFELTGNWYSHEPDSMELYIKILYELPDGSRVYAHPNVWERREFTLTLPILQRESNPSLNVNVLIIATNQFDASTMITKSIMIDNSVDEGIGSKVYKDFGIKDLQTSGSHDLNEILSPLLNPPSHYSF